jgi:arsenate reductase
VRPPLKRKKILFVCKENACRSQMASAFAQFYFGDRLDVESAGSAPASEINADMVKAMSEKGIDMAYRKPTSLDAVQGVFHPELMVSMGCEDACPLFPGVREEEWNIPDPAGKGIAFMREIRDELDKRVNALFAQTAG